MFASDTVGRSRKGRLVAVLAAAVGLSAILSATVPAFADDQNPQWKPTGNWRVNVQADTTVGSVKFVIVRKDDPSIEIGPVCAPPNIGVVPAAGATFDSRFEYEERYAAYGSPGCTGKHGPVQSVPGFDPFSDETYTVSVTFAPEPEPPDITPTAALEPDPEPTPTPALVPTPAS